MLNLKFIQEGVNMRDNKKAEAIAAQRVQLISPLLEEGLDPAKAKQIKARICD